MDVDGASAGKRLVGPDGVEELSVGLDFDAELVAVGDLLSVEVLVEDPEARSRTPFWQGLFRFVRMWISSGWRSMKAVKRADLKHGPLSLTSATGRSSPVR